MTMVSNNQAASDETLVQRARGGDAGAFEALVMRHADRLCGSLRHFGLDANESQEVAQETFLRAWRGLPNFEARSSFFTWLYRIGFNEAQRRLARRPTAGTLIPGDLADAENIADLRPGPAARFETGELRQAMDTALRELPLDLRAPVVLRDVQGLSVRQAAAILDIGEAALKSRLHRGRVALRGQLSSLIVPS
jgi:RNA polymerase sigma-70 factor (ECF subfamily)